MFRRIISCGIFILLVIGSAGASAIYVTVYGKLYLTMPPADQIPLGTIPSGGIPVYCFPLPISINSAAH